MRLVTLVLPVLLAAPLAAQDLAGEYIAAARVFSLPGAPNDPEEQMLAAREMVAALAGAWVPAWILLDDISGPDGLGRVAMIGADLPGWCGRLQHQATPLGLHSFEMRTINNGEDSGFAVRHQYVLGRSFQRSVDEVAHLTRLGLQDRPDDIPPMLYGNPGISGVVEVFRPSANVLVIQPQGGTAEIYLRCR